MPRYGFRIMHWRKSANKAVIGTFFAALRFGVATPHKNNKDRHCIKSPNLLPKKTVGFRK
jgi:hypothetical protein